MGNPAWAASVVSRFARKVPRLHWTTGCVRPLLVVALPLLILTGPILTGDVENRNRIARAEEPASIPELVTGGAFQTALRTPFNVAWQGNELRSAVQLLQADRRVAILLDRRIDPTAAVELTAEDVLLTEMLPALLPSQRVAARVVGNVVYLGPAAASDSLRTVAALRTAELFDDQRPVIEQQRFALNRQSTVRWDNLARPRALVEQLTKSAGLTLRGADQIPHDLWAAGTMPQVTLSEALLLILVQYDLQFEWMLEPSAAAAKSTSAGSRSSASGSSARQPLSKITGLRLTPMPARVSLPRIHKLPRGQTAASLIPRLQSNWPLAQVNATAEGLEIQGTLEEQEAIERWLKDPVAVASNQRGDTNSSIVEKASRTGTARKEPPTSKRPAADSILLKRFTLAIKDVPLKSLLETLQKNPDARLTVEYDVDQFQEAGINLGQRINLEIRNATIDELLRTALKETPLTFEREERHVRLKIKPPSAP